MALSQQIIQKQTQRLVITQDLRQSIELLPLSNLELSERINKELLENPLLESADGSASEEDPTQPKPGQENRAEVLNDPNGEGDGEWWENTITESSTERAITTSTDYRQKNAGLKERGLQESYAGAAERTERKHQFLENAISSEEKLADHLLWQIRLSDLSEDEKFLAEYIITSINDKGFLSVALEELIEEMNRTIEEAQSVLNRIYELDPIGCGAIDVQQTLLIQTQLLQPEDHITKQLLSKHLIDIEKLNFKKIEKETGLSASEIESSLQFIRTLEPYPGSLYSSRQSVYVVPDIIVEEEDGKVRAFINDDWLPEIRINHTYQDLLKGNETDSVGVGRDDKEFLKTRLNSANWLIKSVRQRRLTLEKVTLAIIDYQEDFFKVGAAGLRPLTLRDIAEKVELHESTVSRITTNKYMQTRWGVFELKFFFSSALRSNEGGEERSARDIQERIKHIIENEDVSIPLSDQSVADRIAQEGVRIARRTVAKYRQSLRIPAADVRRKMSRIGGKKSPEKSP